MEKTAFSPADILLPHDCGLTKWAVVACDQYTSQPEYWERVDQYVGTPPPTLRLILPESKLESDNVDEEIQKDQRHHGAVLTGRAPAPGGGRHDLRRAEAGQRQDPPGPAGQAGPGRVQL